MILAGIIDWFERYCTTARYVCLISSFLFFFNPTISLMFVEKIRREKRRSIGKVKVGHASLHLTHTYLQVKKEKKRYSSGLASIYRT